MEKPVNLVIFASRENIETTSNTLLHSLQAVSSGSRIDILINGNRNLSEKLHRWIACKITDYKEKIKIWQISIPDKGNAWNQHIHSIWRQDMDAVYIDGYVRITSYSVSALLKTLKSNPLSLGTSGIPTIGYSSKIIQHEMRKTGGFHGNLCCIKMEALDQMRIRNIRIPLGMYRVDGLIGQCTELKHFMVKYHL